MAPQIGEHKSEGNSSEDATVLEDNCIALSTSNSEDPQNSRSD